MQKNSQWLRHFLFWVSPFRASPFRAVFRVSPFGVGRWAIVGIMVAIVLTAPAEGQDVGASPKGAGTNSPTQSPGRATSTGSESTKIASSKRLTDVIYAGGPLMIPIAICSFLLTVFTFERMIALRKGRIIPGPFVTRFLEQLRDRELSRESAVELCDKNDSPVARVFRSGVLKWGRSGVEVEQAILDGGERVTNELRRYLRVINGIATVCPLLGLLGTVLGMIHAFDSIGAASPGALTDPKASIATGISTALITTAAGMTVAIPALISYLYFSSVVDRRVMEIDSLGMKVVTLISAEALADEGRKPVGRTKKSAA